MSVMPSCLKIMLALGCFEIVFHLRSAPCLLCEDLSFLLQCHSPPTREIRTLELASVSGVNGTYGAPRPVPHPICQVVEIFLGGSFEPLVHEGRNRNGN